MRPAAGVFTVLFSLTIVLTVAAEDTRPLPAGVLRLGLQTGYAWLEARFDENGDRNVIGEGEGRAEVANVGLKVELGANDWATVFLNWAPGWNFWSRVDYLDPPLYPTSPGSEAKYNGLFDIKLGARGQLVGTGSPLMDSAVLGAGLGPLVTIPAPQPDWSEQRDRWRQGETYIWGPLGRHAWGFGGVAYVHTEAVSRLYAGLTASFSKFLPTEYESASPFLDYTVDYRYEVAAELEVRYETPVREGRWTEIGTSLSGTFSPEERHDGDIQKNSESWRLMMEPYLVLGRDLLALPLEIRVFLSYSIAGRNESAARAFGLELTTEARAFGRSADTSE